jgi:WD40 repeat protein
MSRFFLDLQNNKVTGRLTGMTQSLAERVLPLAFCTVVVVSLPCGCGAAAKGPAPSTGANTEAVMEPPAGKDEPAIANPPETASEDATVKKPASAGIAGNRPPALSETASSPDINGQPNPRDTELVQKSGAEKSGQPQEKPTPGQLARWARVSFEALQLLACRDRHLTGYVNGMSRTPDGQRYILAGSSLTIWSIGDEEPEHVFLDGSQTAGDPSIQTLAVAPNGKWFAVGDKNGTLHLWSLIDQSEILSKQIYPTGITQIAISPDSQQIATTTYSDEVTIWSAEPFLQTSRFRTGTNSLKRIMYIMQDLLAVAGETTTAWNVTTGQLDQTLSPGRYNYSLGRSGDGKWFVFGDNNGLKLWNIAENKLEATIAGSFSTEERIEFSPDDKFLLTANDATIRIMDLASHQVVQVMDVVGSPLAGASWMPNTNVLVVVSQDGRTRIWGTEAVGQPLQLKPLQAAIEAPDSASSVPATPAQLLQTVDLRSFPRLPGSAPRIEEATNVSYTAPVSLDEAKAFCRYQFGLSGWSEAAGNAATPDQMEFRKADMTVDAAFHPPYQSSAAADGESAGPRIQVDLTFLGNLDLRKLPRVDTAPIEVVYESELTVLYRTRASLLETETSLLRKMHAAGWTAFARLESSHNEQPDSRNLEFLNNGVVARVSIADYPPDPAMTAVQYSKFLNLNTLPVPPDCGFVEFDGSTRPLLVANSSMSLQQACEFYISEMASQGWLLRSSAESRGQESTWLPFIRGQQDVLIGLLARPGGGTLVRVGEQLENVSWQLAKPKPDESSSNAGDGMEAADFPILNTSKVAKFDKDARSIEFQIDAMPLATVAERYSEQLQSVGWTLPDAGIISDEYVYLTFQKQKVDLELRARLKDGNAIVNIQGDGLRWTKPLPVAEQPVSYETWLRRGGHPASLDLLDEYTRAMQALSPGR